MNKNLLLFPIVVTSLVGGLQTLAMADCYVGGTPDWGDVRTVEIVRCQATNSAYPCYYAVFTGAAQSGIDAAMTAYKFHGRNGWYHAESSGSHWDNVIDLLRWADIFNLQIPDTRPPKGALSVIMVDGPEDQLIVSRCNSFVGINASYSDYQSAQHKQFIDLIDKLEAILASLPWQKTKDGATIRDVELHLVP